MLAGVVDGQRLWEALAGGVGGQWGGRVSERVVVRASGRQRGSTIRGNIRVYERVIVSASGMAAEAVQIKKCAEQKMSYNADRKKRR